MEKKQQTETSEKTASSQLVKDESPQQYVIWVDFEGSPQCLGLSDNPLAFYDGYLDYPLMTNYRIIREKNGKAETINIGSKECPFRDRWHGDPRTG